MSREELLTFLESQYLNYESKRIFKDRLDSMFDAVDRNNKLSKITSEEIVVVEVESFKKDVIFQSNLELLSAFQNYIGNQLHLIVDADLRKDCLKQLVSIDIKIVNESDFDKSRILLESIATRVCGIIELKQKEK